MKKEDLNKSYQREENMNKKAELATIGAIIILVGSFFGGFNMIKDTSHPHYIGDKLTHKVYDYSCKNKIKDIPQENKVKFMLLSVAKENNFEFEECK